MNTQQFQSATFDDIIFEHRNKQYGAYAIRGNYETAMRKATVSAIALFLLLICVPLLAAKIAKKAEVLTMGPDIILTPIDSPLPTIDKPAPIKPAALPKTPKQATFKYVAPVIVKDNTPIKPDDAPQTIPDNAIAGTKTQEGTNAGAPTGIDTSVAINAIVTELPEIVETPKKSVVIEEDNKLYTVVAVEQQPVFGNGDVALLQYLADKIKYPVMARENGIDGTVYVEFIIGKDGSVTDAKILRGIGGGCNEEALRVINGMPKWKPGRQQGNPVKVKFTLPIKFKLQ